MKHILFLFAFLLIGSVAIQAQTAADLTGSFASCYAQGDASCVADNFTDDAVMVQGDQKFAGKAAIRDFYKRMLKNGGANLSTNVEDELDMGDYVSVRGTFSATYTDATGQTKTRKGKFQTIAKKMGKKLLIMRHNVEPEGDGTAAGDGSGSLK